MRSDHFLMLLGGLAIGAGLVPAQAATPSLYFQETAVQVAPGGSFDVHVYITVPSAQLPDYNGEVAGLDYFLATTDLSARGKLYISELHRPSGLFPAYPSVFPQALWYDNADMRSGEYINDDPNRPVPNEPTDSLGGFFLTPLTPNPDGTPASYLIAVIKMRVDEALPPSPPSIPYTLRTTVANDAQGWFDTRDERYSGFFLPEATLYITVVPEPAEYAVAAGAGLLALALYRRWRAAV